MKYCILVVLFVASAYAQGGARGKKEQAAAKEPLPNQKVEASLQPKDIQPSDAAAAQHESSTAQPSQTQAPPKEPASKKPDKVDAKGEGKPEKGGDKHEDATPPPPAAETEAPPPPPTEAPTEPPTEPPPPVTRGPLACGTDFTLILDNSGSVTDEWEITKAQAASLIDAIDMDQRSNRIALIVYNYAASVLYSFEKQAEKNEVVETIKGLSQFGGSTNTWDALKTAAEDFNSWGRPNVHRVICMLTDGNSENSIENLELISKKLQENGTEIYVATASGEPGIYEFKAYSVGHPERVFMKGNLTNMVPTVSQIVNSFSCRNVPQAAAAAVFRHENKVRKDEVARLPGGVNPQGHSPSAAPATKIPSTKAPEPSPTTKKVELPKQAKQPAGQAKSG